MTPGEFKRKWARYSGKETSAYQEHFNDLCALLGQPTPATADPTGSESFCFQKRVVKDEELFALAEPGRVAEEPGARTRARFRGRLEGRLFRLGIQGQKEKSRCSLPAIASLSGVAAKSTATRRLRFRSLHHPNQFQQYRSGNA